jgi:hypothetical protein
MSQMDEWSIRAAREGNLGGSDTGDEVTPFPGFRDVWPHDLSALETGSPEFLRWDHRPPGDEVTGTLPL